MKTFQVSLFKGADTFPILQEVIEAENSQEAKKKFRTTDKASWLKNPKNWIGTKRIR